MTKTDWDQMLDFAKSRPILSSVKNAEDFHRARSYIAEKLKRNPLVQEYVRLRTPKDAVEAAGKCGFRNTLPWHAYAEQMMTALSLSSGFFDPSQNVKTDDWPALSLSMGMMCLAAQPYLWTSRIEELVRSSPDVPPLVIEREMMAFPVMFFSFEVCHFSDDFPGADYMNWLLMMDRGDEIFIMSDVGYKEEVRVVCGSIKVGSKWPEDFKDPRERLAVGFILKYFGFINSPCTTTETHRVPRSFRREAQRNYPKNSPPLDPTIRVVVLRREHARSIESYESEGVDRKHHWWVSGHYRNQYYPAHKSHKVIWIAPHIKGDLSMPLLQKVYSCERP